MCLGAKRLPRSLRFNRGGIGWPISQFGIWSAAIAYTFIVFPLDRTVSLSNFIPSFQGDALRCGICRIDQAHESQHAKSLKCVVANGGSRLGSVTASPKCGHNDIDQFDLITTINCFWQKPAMANYHSQRRVPYNRLKVESWSRCSQVALERSAYLLIDAWTSHEASHLFISPERSDLWYVGLRKQSDREPRGLGNYTHFVYHGRSLAKAGLPSRSSELCC